ncbi:MAG TPA: membrane protein insertase YidC, partial [Alphaproteobacteria bacterium]|nr:membrane protein insertase YidC [Alphaproteobacteria bacterium]
MSDQRNLFIAIAVSLAILLGFQYFYEAPRNKARQAEQQAQQQSEQAQQPGQKTAQGGTQAGGTQAGGAQSGGAQSGSHVTPSPQGASQGTLGNGGPTAETAESRGTALDNTARLPIDGQRVKGSIALTGGRIDDVTLSDYHVTVDKTSPPVTLLSPPGSPNPYYANVGWTAQGNDVKVPGADTRWHADGGTLGTDRPVTLSWDNGQGVTFQRVLNVDHDYLFTVTQRVVNHGDKPLTLYPYGLVSRTHTPKTLGYYILHEGPLGVLDGSLKELDYKDLRKNGTQEHASKGGWLGITDKYWLAAVIPDQKSEVRATFRHFKTDGVDRYQTDFIAKNPVTVPPGGSAEVQSRVFAGAKEVHLLDRYADNYGIDHFDLAVDFGWFYFLTKPLFYMLDFFFNLLGNFGLAIMLLTVCVKTVFFPLANKSYKSMSKMKALQPEVQKLRERYGDDRQKLNQAMMQLYKEQKVNPASGCLPIVIQIPVFFALYKVMFVTIEMRHQPFFGWIHDLSVPDPTTIFNLFGLIPWDPPLLLSHLGAWPLAMGLSMFLQQRLNPQPADPIQAKVFMFMPIFFTFLLAKFPAGLVVYWTWNNSLSIIQQWLIMKRMGVKRGGSSGGSG